MTPLIKECEQLVAKFGHLPFDKALPFLQEGWWEIGRKHDLTGPEVFTKYMDWKSKQKANK
ncbi:hypothetical protein J1P26_17250 [Neobacillus sp. MM2021_6]|uniref:hypothetical protein n=1 Tax=Bacillaceae TaxID=186817 RepID=UPI00140E49F1|nr:MULTISPECIES: hypothetical protein [Bacillaceae]MBO0961455.1 hypothetical protein [Neobacillus sp. MM2021_6]NHC19560.1 hypothetical protein [Bacillus sp. MM2020_4]